ncbi:MAG: hypothetical protein ACRBK7_20850 [Acidimicrobiales bacterium]
MRVVPLRRPPRYVRFGLLFAVLIGASFWAVDRLGPGRRTTSVGAAFLYDPATFEVIVDSCNGDPQLVDLDESTDEVRIRVVSWHPGYFDGGDDCLDQLEVTLTEPLGDRRLVDASSGDEIEVDGLD